MFCPNCGAFIRKEGAFFCEMCGQPLEPTVRSDAYGTPPTGEKNPADRNHPGGNRGLVVIVISLFVLLCGTQLFVWRQSYHREPLTEPIAPTGSVGSGGSSMEPSWADDSESESVINGIAGADYLDVFPDGAEYYPGVIRIWDEEAGDKLNLRSGPGAKYTLLDQLTNGEDVIRLSAAEGEYCLIYCPSTERYGWVLARYVGAQP